MTPAPFTRIDFDRAGHVIRVEPPRMFIPARSLPVLNNQRLKRHELREKMRSEARS